MSDDPLDFTATTLDLPALLPDREQKDHQDSEARFKAFTERRQKHAMEWFWGCREGRSLAWAIFEITDFFRETGYSSNAVAMAKNMGRREFAQWLFNILMEDHPDKLVLMRRENGPKASA